MLDEFRRLSRFSIAMRHRHIGKVFREIEHTEYEKAVYSTFEKLNRAFLDTAVLVEGCHLRFAP